MDEWYLTRFRIFCQFATLNVISRTIGMTAEYTPRQEGSEDFRAAEAADIEVSLRGTKEEVSLRGAERDESDIEVTLKPKPDAEKSRAELEAEWQAASSELSDILMQIQRRGLLPDERADLVNRGKKLEDRRREIDELTLGQEPASTPE